MRYYPPPEERLFKKVDKSGECWLWTGGKTHDGYGMMTIKGKTTYVHRLSYQLHKGEIPEGMYVCHSCDVPSCINPDHLWLGNNADNMKDMYKKERRVHVRSDTCKRGHVYEEVGFSIRNAKGVERITCLGCKRMREAKYRASK